MLFNSYEFIFIFLPITFFIYFYLNSQRVTHAATAFLVLSSLFFYSWWNIVYLPLILSSMLFNFTVGKTFNTLCLNRHKKSLLAIGVLTNLLLLGYFKYADFFISNINTVLNDSIPLLRLALPLAISFFTFQQIAYLVDSYRSEIKEYDFLKYALFVTFFPQLIAGPIVHHKEMMPQFDTMKNKAKNYRNIAIGLFIFSIGLFKKVVIADTFAVWANAGFDTATTLDFFEAWVTSLSYTFQLYFDFSGYTDMAIGIALLFNIKLPINFNSPYKAGDIQDFWRRWHMTLSRFLKDYIYIPLGGNRRGEPRTYINLFTTFFLGGLWHGAGWNFILWGVLHGIALIIHRIWKSFGFTMNKYLAWFITFNFINFTWIFFRSKELSDAVKIIVGMIGVNGFSFPQQLNYHSFFSLILWSADISFESDFLGILILICIIFIVILYCKNSNEKIEKFNFSNKNLLTQSGFLIFSILLIQKKSEFLYFNF